MPSPHTDTSGHHPRPLAKWREIQRESFTQLDTLLSFLQIQRSSLPPLLENPLFSLNLPRRLAEKIKKGDPDDPLLRQFLPLREEETSPAPFSKDPLCEEDFAQTPSLLHKYKSRALLITTSACAMHCRYCFRRHFPYENRKTSLTQSLAYLENTPSIREVILSGGDPLSLSDRELRSLFEKLENIGHLSICRIHTRFLLGIPERVTEDLLRLFMKSRLQVVCVLHSNHAKEWDQDIQTACERLKGAGATLLNQSVLLKGVNDSSEALEELSWRLIEAGVIPYYLHQLDRVEGTHHFLVEVERGKEMIRDLRARIPGYAVPLYVQEEPHAKSKTPIHVDLDRDLDLDPDLHSVENLHP